MNGIFNPKKALKNFILNHSKYEKKENFNKNVNSLIKQIKDTNRKIAIISDFDFTLTRRFDLNNEQINYFSTYCVLENFSEITENFKKNSQKLYNDNHKYETDETLDFPTRNELVLKWYRDNLDLIVGENLTKSHFEDMMDHSHEKFYFRQGILELFEIVLEYKIPFYIISGGLHDIIEHSLKAVIPFYKLLEENKLINIIANKFIYDEKTQKMTGYQEPLVYTFNKGEVIKKYFLFLKAYIFENMFIDLFKLFR